MKRIDRMFGILLRLRAGRTVSATELALTFEVSPRTIYRDVDALSALGVPIFSERGRVGGFRLLEGYFLPALALTQDEAVSLLLGLSMLQGLRVRPFARGLDSAERKLLAAMPEHLALLLADSARFVGFESAPEGPFPLDSIEPQADDAARDNEPNTVDQFLGAILSGSLVRMEYRSPYRSSSRAVAVAPRAIFNDRQRWYLVGKQLEPVAGQRLWRADRVLQIEVTAQSAARDPTFDVRTMLGRKWLGSAMRDWTTESPVRLRLTPQQAERLRRDWYYEHAQFEPAEHEAVIMTFGESRRSFVFELLRWLGPGAELLEPLDWREEFRDELFHMAESYAATAQ